MFDLNEAMKEWREQMLAAGIKSPVPLEELESHLRDDLEQQMDSGKLTRQAFDSAVQRIGQPGALKNEFYKINGTAERKPMKRTLTIFAGLFGMFMGISAILPALGKHYRDQPGGWTSQETSGLQLGIALAIIGASIAFLAIRKHREIRGRKAIFACLAALGTYYLFWEILVLFKLLQLSPAAAGWVAVAALLTGIFFGRCLQLSRAPSVLTIRVN